MLGVLLPFRNDFSQIATKQVKVCLHCVPDMTEAAQSLVRQTQAHRRQRPRTQEVRARQADVLHNDTHVCTATRAACEGVDMHSNTKITINMNTSLGVLFPKRSMGFSHSGERASGRGEQTGRWGQSGVQTVHRAAQEFFHVPGDIHGLVQVEFPILLEDGVRTGGEEEDVRESGPASQPQAPGGPSLASSPPTPESHGNRASSGRTPILQVEQISLWLFGRHPSLISCYFMGGPQGIHFPLPVLICKRTWLGQGARLPVTLFH